MSIVQRNTGIAPYSTHEVYFTAYSLYDETEAKTGDRGQLYETELGYWYAVSVPAAGEFLKKFLVECLVFVERPHRHEDVSTDELVNDLTVGAQTLERHLVISVVTTQFNLQFTAYSPL